MQPSSSGDANSLAILEECQEVDCKLDQLDDQLNNLKRVFAHVLARPGTTSDEVNRLNLQIIESYSALARRVKNIRSRSESASRRNASHVRKVNDRLNGTFQRYQMLQSEFRRDSEAAAERQYRIVCPEATDAEIKEAVTDPDTPIFQQALHSSDRRGQAKSTLRNVKERHESISNVERQMIELAQLFQDLNQIVQQQEPLVVDVEQNGEEVRENVTEGNEEISTAIVSARAHNRKKWWCLLAVVFIIIVVGVVVGVVVTIYNKKQ